MRVPRKQTLQKTGIFHKIWQGHNRERVLESNEDKSAYLDSLVRTLDEDIVPFVAWHSFCLMSNHPHETGRLNFTRGHAASVKALGDWMRNAHSRFGAGYNRRHNRKGKVSCERPKTKEVAPREGLLNVMFYGDANPVYAGMVSHPSNYRYSSYHFYAYGKKNPYTEKLTPPAEYLALGNTASARQKRYRQLCDAYLRKNNLISDRPLELEEANPISTEPHPDIIECSRGDPVE